LSEHSRGNHARVVRVGLHEMLAHRFLSPQIYVFIKLHHYVDASTLVTDFAFKFSIHFLQISFVKA
jgi:hypothetical protein